MLNMQCFFKQFWPKIGKMIDLSSKLKEINGIEQNKDSKIYPQNQVILDCIMPPIPLKHKCLSIILIWVIVSHKLVVVSKRKKKPFFFLLFLIGEKQTWYWKKGDYFLLAMVLKFCP